MNHMQALVDGMSAQWARERAETQMTLGKMIEALEAMPPERAIDRLGELDSYRGYYSDLAFEPASGKMPAAELLNACKAAMGKVFQGYKGGDFMMGALTPLWIAPYGCCGQKIMGFTDDGEIIKADDE